MARLPTPVVEEIEVLPLGNDNNTNIKTFYKMIGQAIRKAEVAKKKGRKGKDETD